MSLWELCSLGKVDEARAALNEGEDVNSRNVNIQNGTVLMSVACNASSDHISILKLLLEQPSIEVNLAGDMGLTALHVVTFNGNIEAVRLLLADPRVDVNKTETHVANETALMMAAGLDPSETQVSVLRLLLEHPSIEVNLADDEGYTALHRASRGIIRFKGEGKSVTRSIEPVRLLLANPSIEVNCKESFEELTPLMMTTKGPLDIFELLLSDPRIDVNSADRNGMTALMLSLLLCNVKAVKLLLDDKRVDVNNSSGLNALHLAAATAWDVMRKKKKKKVVARALHIMKMFLGHPRVDVNCKIGPGVTVLHMAALTNNVQNVKLILAEPRFTSANALNEDEDTAVTIAASKGNWDVLKELVHHPSIDLGGKDNNGLDELIR